MKRSQYIKFVKCELRSRDFAKGSLIRDGKQDRGKGVYYFCDALSKGQSKTGSLKVNFLDLIHGCSQMITIMQSHAKCPLLCFIG